MNRKKPGKQRLVLARQLAEVARRTQDENVHHAHPRTLLGRQLAQHEVHPLEAQHVLVDQVEEDRVVQDAQHLRRRRIAADERAVRLLLCAIVTRRDRENLVRARGAAPVRAAPSVECRRRRATNPRSSPPGRRTAAPTSPSRVRPLGASRCCVASAAPIPRCSALHPDDRLAGAVVGRAERDGTQRPASDVLRRCRRARRLADASTRLRNVRSGAVSTRPRVCVSGNGTTRHRGGYPTARSS